MSAETTASPLLRVNDLRTWFPTSRGTLHAVDGVSIQLHAGRTLGIVGESGSGKSILARSIMNLLPTSAIRPSGEVIFDGTDLARLGAKASRAIWGRDVAMVFQDPMTSLNPVVRIKQQITEVLHRHLELDRAEARLRALELLGHVGIPEPERRLRAYPHELSGGMRQRVSIAIALACRPRLLIADEPTTALDVTIQRQILDLLGSLQRDEGMAMVLITHNLGIVAGRCNDIAVMYGGQVVESGPTDVVFEKMRHPYTTALLASIPRVEGPSDARLHIIRGRPVNVIDPRPGCRFAPRCEHAQPRCLLEDPPVVEASPGHQYSCFYPVGTAGGDAALERNVRVGATAAGLQLSVAGTAA